MHRNTAECRWVVDSAYVRTAIEIQLWCITHRAVEYTSAPLPGED